MNPNRTITSAPARLIAGLLVGLLVGPLAVVSGPAWAATPAVPEPRPAAGAGHPIGLVRDINPGARSIDVEPRSQVALGDRLLLALDDGRHGREPWITDGSAAGTRLLADIRPGRGPEGRPYGSRVDGFYVDGGRAWFFADDGRDGFELWRTDGTRRGTVRVTELPGRQVAVAGVAAAFDGSLFFVVDDRVHGYELWRTDRSAAGAHLVVDLQPGRRGSAPSDFVPLGDRLLFSAYDRAHGRELWSTDGTAAGTTLVADLRPPAEETPDQHPAYTGSRPYALRLVGDHVYFFTEDGEGLRLWWTDGTEEGTRRVEARSPAGDIHPSQVYVLGRRLVFVAHALLPGYRVGPDRLWAADENGARRISDVRVVDMPDRAAGGRLVLAARGDRGAPGIWRTDGTRAGTRLVRLVPRRSWGAIPELTVAGRRTFFVAGSGGEQALWVSDGTGRGTRRFARLDSYVIYAYAYLAAAGGDLYLQLRDRAHGLELWSTARAATARSGRLATS